VQGDEEERRLRPDAVSLRRGEPNRSEVERWNQGCMRAGKDEVFWLGIWARQCKGRRGACKCRHACTCTIILTGVRNRRARLLQSHGHLKVGQGIAGVE